MIILLNVLVVMVLFIVVLLLGLKFSYKRPAPGEVLVVESRGQYRVAFKPTLVVPLIQHAWRVDIRVKTLLLEPSPKEMLRTKDDQLISYKIHLQVKINQTVEDVLKVAQFVGCEHASEPETLMELLRPNVVAALKRSAREVTFSELRQDSTPLIDHTLAEIGQELSGYVIHDLVVESVERASLKGDKGPFR